MQVTFENQTIAIRCSRAEFLTKVSEIFEIEEDDIDIYDKKTGSKISVQSLQGIMNVEIKKKSLSIQNGERSEPSTSRAIDETELLQKLRGNENFTDAERRFLINFLQLIECENAPKRTKNVKIQVTPQNLFLVTSVATQTDNHFLNFPSRKRPLSTNETKTQCKRLATAGNRNPAEVKTIMDELYNERRSFILHKLPLVSFVKEKYPLLFSFAEVQNEIERILHEGKCKKFYENIARYAMPILTMARDDDPLLKKIKKSASCKPLAVKKHVYEIGSLLMLPSLLNEGRNYLKLIDLPLGSPKYPYIQADAMFEDIFECDCSFEVYIEGHLLCKASDFKEAILCLIASFFIFNVQFTPENINTFVAYECLYLEYFEKDIFQNFNVPHVIQVLKAILHFAKEDEKGLLPKEETGF